MVEATPWIRDVGGSTEILVHVQPGARRSGIVGVHGDALKVAVRAKATEGAANRAVCELIAGILSVAGSAVAVTSGRRSRRKWIRVDGVKASRASEAITRLLP